MVSPSGIPQAPFPLSLNGNELFSEDIGSGVVILKGVIQYLVIFRRYADVLPDLLSNLIKLLLAYFMLQ